MPRSPEPDRDAATPQRLSVIVINDFASVTGGSDRVAFTEAVALAERGHQVTLIAGHGEPAPELTAAGVTVRLTGQHTTLGHPNRLSAGAQGVWNRTSARLVDQVLSAADPDTTVVHVHGVAKVLSPSVVRAALRSGLGVVATLHDYFAACPNGGFFNYQTGEICRLDPLSARCVASHCDARSYSHKLWRVGRTAVQWRVGHMPSGIRHFIAPSRFAADILRPYLPGAAILHVVPNPISVGHQAPADVAGNSEFIAVGRLSQDKGPALFAEAARKAGVQAVFVGAGDEEATIRRMNPDAEITGWLEPAEVETRLRSARAVVSSSLWYEVQPLAALEAAAHGLPAIIPDNTAFTELVPNGVAGLWFRGGDSDDLAEKLKRLAGDDQLARSLGTAAHERFWTGGWGVEDHVARLEGIYRQALAQREHVAV